ncbi:DNA-3-methyladenine glycosylase [Nocardioides sp. GY 10127]|uniref:DNA-3-methyladenine glycosylase n=1 Tax=Nocardioides sp. GY 10127 TaxID=2569762 RepID=UPI0010A8733F|nr:DNA-3-methyladenine glycosylase [Nocardioides sp. GY 10127]TIC78717.1 DNA-3-methyladenine glycosylase [Nocardioides sp. GY 10127]TIC81065.1 DNA-3-methyladenine glycosylase [Nocardioides sp. GY 10127]
MIDWTAPPETVAPLLLGATLTHAGVTVRLTEVEAYGGADDPGSHALRGPTARNASMFGAPAHLYCYFTYGMHVCANVVTGPEGEGGAVLLRAGEVLDGLALARERRPGSSTRDLARGPARLVRCLALSLEDDGLPLLGDGAPRLEPTVTPVDPDRVQAGPRVGLRRAADRPWRWWLAGERSVSAYRPAAVRKKAPGG